MLHNGIVHRLTSKWPGVLLNVISLPYRWNGIAMTKKRKRGEEAAVMPREPWHVTRIAFLQTLLQLDLQRPSLSTELRLSLLLLGCDIAPDYPADEPLESPPVRSYNSAMYNPYQRMYPSSSNTA